LGNLAVGTVGELGLGKGQVRDLVKYEGQVQEKCESWKTLVFACTDTDVNH